MLSSKELPIILCCFYLFEVTSAIVGLDFRYNAVDDLPRAVLTYPNISGGMTEMTVCIRAHLKSEDNKRDIALVSYSSRETKIMNEILLEVSYEAKTTQLYISHNYQGARINAVPPSNQWTHICASWESQNGRADFYFDGSHVGHQTGYRTGHIIGGDGYLVVGQDQDWYDGGYNVDNAVVGRLTQFHIWNRALSPTEVKAVFDCALRGNVVNWLLSQWRLTQNLEIIPSTAPCFKRRDYDVGPKCS